MDIALVAGEVEDGFVVARGLLHLLAQPVEVAAVACLCDLGEHLGYSRPDSLEPGELVAAVQRLYVGPLDRERPRRRRERFGPEALLWVLPQQVADLRKHLRRRD